MDREEYHQKLDELTGLVKKKDYEGALAIVDEIDWRRVKSINTLNMVADVYEVNREYEQAKKILTIAHDRAPIGRGILYRLVELCIRLNKLDEAERYFKEFTNVAKNDNSRCILQYKLYKAKQAPIEAQIDVLEEYREREYTERWAYELAVLYSRAGDTRKCVDACDDLILWFSEGRYVFRALELKKRYEALTPSQEQAYAKMEPEYRRDKRNHEDTTDDASETVKDAADRADAYASRVARAAAERSAAEISRQQNSREDGVRNHASGNPAPAAVEKNVSSDDFRNRIARSFRNVFALNEEEEGLAEAEAAEAARDQAELNSSIDAEQKYISEKGLKLRELKEEKPAAAEVQAEKASTLIPEEDTESVDSGEKETAVNFTEDLQQENTDVQSDARMNTADFDLDAFLAEMAGSFKAEMEDGVDSIEHSSEAAEPEADVANVSEAAESEVIVDDLSEAAESEAIVDELSEAAESEVTVDDLSEVAEPETDAEEASEAAEQEMIVDKVSEAAEIASIAEEPSEVRNSSEVDGAEEITTEAAEIPEPEIPVAEAPGDEAIAAAMDAIVAAAEADAADSALDLGLAAEAIVSENEALQKDENSEEPDAAATADESDQMKTDEGKNMADSMTEEKKTPKYNEELEIPDPEPTQEERRTRTIPFNTIGSNTIPISIDKILSEETPEERRIRILNKAKPTRMSEDQRKIFTYFARIPGMDAQILEAVNSVYEHAGEKTSLHGNIAIMGARGTGKSRLAHGLIVAMCKDLGMDAAKVARITGKSLNSKDPAKVVSMMAGGFLVIEDISDVNAETLDKLNQAMEFRTDCMIMIIEDEKNAMRMFLKKNPQFASKFDQTISVPVFTNDELVTFARTYATENGCKIDDMAVLALYTMIGNSQSEEEPTTISTVKDMLDDAINRATKGKRRKAVQDAVRNGKWTILHEKDFVLN